MEKYYIIYFGEDGTGITVMGKEDVMEEIKDVMDEHNEMLEGDGTPYSGEPFLDSVPNDINEVCYQRLIIKGKIITPEPIKTVTKFRVD